MGAQENKLRKLQILQNEILRMTILSVFSQFLWNLFPRAPIKNCLWRLLQITYFIIWLSLFSPSDWSICGPSDLIYGPKSQKQMLISQL